LKRTFKDDKGRQWHPACYWKEKARAGLKTFYIERIDKGEVPGKCSGCGGILNNLKKKG
jgi:hypothetical protein